MNPYPLRMLDRQTVFVSGAAAGHGREYARGVVRAGGIVIANDVNREQLGILKAELGECCIALPGDIGAADELLRQAIERAGALDAIVTNAGWSGAGAIADQPAEVFDSMVRTNLRGCFLACQAALRHWRSRNSPGRIVNIASRTGLWPHRGHGGYAATKAGIVALTLAIAEEVDGTGVVANVVCPRGWSASRVRPVNLPEYSQGGEADGIDDWDPVNLVAPVLYLCSERAGWCNGLVFAVEGNQLQWLHGWSTASGIRKGAVWQPEEMDEAFRRLTGVMTQMSDEGKDRYQSVAGIAARGRLEWL